MTTVQHHGAPAGPRPRALLLAALAGLGQAVALAQPGSGQPLWWLQILSLAGLAALLRRAGGTRRAFALGWLFATVWLVGSFWWLFISMHRYGGLAAPLAGAAVLALALALGSYYAVAAALWWRWRPGQRLGAALLFAALWLLAELARGQWWTGFPWGAGGYAHVQGPLVHLARYGGVYGIGAVAALLAMLAVQLRARDLRSARAWALLLALALAWGAAAWQRQQALAAGDAAARPALTLALLQGNVAQDEKFQPGSGVAQSLQWYGELLRSVRADLVVAPETAVPLLPRQLPEGWLDAVAQYYQDAAAPQALLLGMPLGDAAAGYTNSALGLAPGLAAPYRYDKHHLVPFGEFVPPLFRWFTELMQIPLGDFRRGPLVQPAMDWRGERLAPNICYEDLFGEELAARFADARQAPTVLVNMSNIGWFGDTLAVDQHLAIGRMRTLELERPMVRATNTGATAVIDHRGRVTARLPAFTRGVLHASVQGRAGSATPYARWAGRWGLAPLWALGLAVLGGCWWRGRGRNAAGQVPRS